MNKKLLLKNLLVATTLALLFSGTASADDKKIIVTGRITAQTCTVVNPENFIRLPDTPMSGVPAKGEAGVWRDDNIKVACPGDQYPKELRLVFNPGPIDLTTGTLKNSKTGTSAATGINIQLADTNKIPYNFDDGQIRTPPQPGAKEVFFNVNAAYFRNNYEELTEGEVEAVIVLDLEVD